MTRHEFFCKRLRELRLYDDESDYGGMIGESVEMLSAVLMAQHHSGMSANIVVGVFNGLIDEYNKGATNEKTPTGNA